MSLLDELKRKADVIARSGSAIRDEARAAGTTFSYVDPANPDVIIVEQGDGETQRVLPAVPRSAKG
ncbi:hypothetical protein AAIH46_01910 [Rhizobium sp. 0TCS1.26]|uniref:hypothetical protein n=1 Tax=Rhizobium sp. 0TCS1.26 TaxID=3142623 RepID=UPI003D2A7611